MMKYRDKTKPKQTQQHSTRDFYDPIYNTTYICPICGRTYKEYEYQYKKLCCKTSLQRIQISERK